MSGRDVLARNLSFLMDRYPDVGSQKLLFKLTGVTTSTVGRIRRGEVSATIDNVEALAKAFKISLPELLHPKLPEQHGGLKDPTLRDKAMSLATDIETANLSESQLIILANTLAAMRST